MFAEGYFHNQTHMFSANTNVVSYVNNNTLFVTRSNENLLRRRSDITTQEFFGLVLAALVGVGLLGVRSLMTVFHSTNQAMRSWLP